MSTDAMEIDKLQAEDAKDCQFGTKGIELQLEKLGIKVLGEARAKLPNGWSLAPQAMHRGSPTVIVNADGVEMARWDGGWDKARFFVCVGPGVYSADDQAYMTAHVWCGHADCHEVKTKEYVAALKKANKRRESAAKSRAKRKAAEKTTEEKKGKRQKTDEKVSQPDERNIQTFPTIGFEHHFANLGCIEMIGRHEIACPKGWTTKYDDASNEWVLLDASGKEQVRGRAQIELLHMNTGTNVRIPPLLWKNGKTVIVFEFKQATLNSRDEYQVVRTELFTDIRAAQILFEYLPQNSVFYKNCTIEECIRLVEHPTDVGIDLINGCKLYIRHQECNCAKL